MDSKDGTTTLYLSNASEDQNANVLEAVAGRAAHGVRGFSVNGVGVVAASDNGTGLHATSTSGSAIVADCQANAPTIMATHTGASANYSLIAYSANGIGVLAIGEQSPIMLGAHSQEGPPQSGTHYPGELFLDVKIDLYLCKTGGTPGTWKLIG